MTLGDFEGHFLLFETFVMPITQLRYVYTSQLSVMLTAVAVQRSVLGRGVAPGEKVVLRGECSCTAATATCLVLTQSHSFISHLIDCNQSVLCSADRM